MLFGSFLSGSGQGLSQHQGSPCLSTRGEVLVQPPLLLCCSAPGERCWGLPFPGCLSFGEAEGQQAPAAQPLASGDNSGLGYFPVLGWGWPLLFIQSRAWVSGSCQGCLYFACRPAGVNESSEARRVDWVSLSKPSTSVD